MTRTCLKNLIHSLKYGNYQSQQIPQQNVQNAQVFGQNYGHQYQSPQLSHLNPKARIRISLLLVWGTNNHIAGLVFKAFSLLKIFRDFEPLKATRPTPVPATRRVIPQSIPSPTRSHLPIGSNRPRPTNGFSRRFYTLSNIIIFFIGNGARRPIDRPQSNLKTIRGSPPGAKHKNVYRPHKQYAGKIDDLEGKNMPGCGGTKCRTQYIAGLGLIKIEIKKIN